MARETLALFSNPRARSLADCRVDLEPVDEEVEDDEENADDDEESSDKDGDADVGLGELVGVVEAIGEAALCVESDI